MSGLVLEFGSPWAFNPEDFGPVGIGDDTAALQGAIDAAAAQSSTSQQGGVVLVRPTTYLTTGLVMKSGVTLTSLARNRPYIASSPRSVATIRAITGSTGWVIDTPAGLTDEWSLSGIAIRGYASGGAGTGGIRLQNCHFATIEKCWIDNCNDQGILQLAGFACNYDDIGTTNVVLNHTRAGVTGAVDLAGSDHYMNACEWGASLSGITDPTNQFIVAARIAASTCFIEQSNGESSDQGWYISGSRNRFSDIRGDINWGHGIQVVGGQNQFSVCSASSNGRDATNTYDGFRVSGSSNLFTACSALQVGGLQTHKYSFNDTTSFQFPYQRNSFVGCNGGAAGTDYGTKAYNASTFQGSGVLHSPHRMRFVNGDTTPSVSQGTVGDFVNYSAPATITAFDDGTEGQTIKLLPNPTNAITIANNAAIKTNTGLPRVLAANNIYTYTLIGDVWYEDAVT